MEGQSLGYGGQGGGVGGGGGAAAGAYSGRSSQSPNPSPSPSHSHSASATSSGAKRSRRMMEDAHLHAHAHAHAHAHGHPHAHGHAHAHPTSSSMGMGLLFPGGPPPPQYPHHILHGRAHGHGHGHGHGAPHSHSHLAISSLSDDGSHSHSQSQLDSMSAANTEGFEDEDEDEEVQEGAEEDEDEEEDAENDSLQRFTPARLENPGPSTALRKPVATATEGPKDHPVNGGVGAGAATAGVALPPSNVKEEAGKLPSASADHIQTSGAYCAREEALKREEESGRLKFEFLYNDGVDQHMIWLIGLKNVFARQLPNMPKDYIVRLLMDRNHKSVVIIKLNQVVGGITYRPYHSQKFGEIAFCAITADEQVKGYGTRLMNHLKQYARDVDGLTHFLTYADNNAVGYFIKQGFTKEIEQDKERWHGYIKDYDGAILLECRIDQKLPFTDLPTMVRMQRQALDERIRQLSDRHSVHDGLDIPKKDAGVPRKPLRVEDIPGLKAAGWTVDQAGHSNYRLSNSTSEGPPSRQALHAFMRSLWKALSEQADSWPFREPVDQREVPDYYDIIKDPMDLKTMLKRLESEQYYLTLDMFVADVKRMFHNARTYNSAETVYYRCATKLDSFFKNKLLAGAQHINKSQQ